MSTLLHRAAALVALSAFTVSLADAQPRRTADAQFGTVTASADLSTTTIQAGGPDRNAVPGSGCSGFIRNAAPTASVVHGGGVLSIYAMSDTDTTLLVADPAGRWHCSDDAEDIHPGVTFASGAAGTYMVWVGTFSPDAAGAAARLYVVQGAPRW